MLTPESEVMDIVSSWGDSEHEDVASWYTRDELEELFYKVYGFYPRSSLLKTKIDIVRQLRDRMNTMARASAFQNAGKRTSAVSVRQMVLETTHVVEHAYTVTYHERTGEVVTKTMRSHTMGSLVKKLENAGAVVWKVERED